MIRTLSYKNVSIICPQNRVENYLAYCAHVFKISKVKFIKEIKFLEQNTDIVFIDQKNLVSDKIELLFKKKINLLVILLWNSDRDYFTYKNKIISLKKKFKVQLLSVSNFSKNIYFPLNNFKIKRKPSLISISGIRLLKRIKYNFPLIHGLYNFIKYFNVAKIFVQKQKLVYVGIGNKNDVINQLIWLRKQNYSKQINKICRIIINDIKKLSYIDFNKKFYKNFNSKLYQDLPIPLKFFFTQVAIKYLVLSHLFNFKNFYHKNNSSYPLDLLKTNIYKKIYHLNFGNSSGNATAEMRQIYLEKFYKDRYLDLRVFKNNENLQKKKFFKNKFTKFHSKITKFYNFKNYSANLSELLIEIKKIKSS
tara:strand:- start:213 stop:1304 length:1092 start_codon:yes stop_codon:yes gene_type:complete